MQIIEWEQFLKNGLPLGQKLSSMTAGVFDGVHRGHQALIKRIVSYNSTDNPAGYLPGYMPGCLPVVVTFRENYKTEECSADILSFPQKMAILKLAAKGEKR